MGFRNVFQWWSQTVSDLPIIAQDDSLIAGLTSGLIEPFESTPKPLMLEFHRSNLKPQVTRKHSSLLSKAIKSYNIDTCETESIGSTFKNADIACSQSITSLSPGLTSDGSTTNTSRSQTPNNSLNEYSPQKICSGIENLTTGPVIRVYPASSRNYEENKVQVEERSVIAENSSVPFESALSCLELSQPSSLCKRSISFKLNEANSSVSGSRARAKSYPHTTSDPDDFPLELKVEDGTTPRVRKPTIKFVCSGPQPEKVPGRSATSSAPLTSSGFSSARSSFGITSILSQKLTESKGRDTSIQSPSGTSSSYSNHSGDDPPGFSQATRFYEFASEEAEVDDWVRQDLGFLTSKLTINDTLSKENEIRRLASEVEEEEAEYSDDDFEEEEEEDFEPDESDDDDTTFWSPGEASGGLQIPNADASNHVTLAHYSSGYNSSIDSSLNLSCRTRSRRGRDPSKSIVPENSDLLDSTDFVCGTFDEDRPLEEAYLSCIRARKNSKYESIPQDIDPSFPISDTDEQEKDDKCVKTNSIERQRPNSGKLELNDERLSQTHSTNRGSVSRYSSNKLHSPPPKYRLRSPTQKPCKSPKRLHPINKSQEYRQPILIKSNGRTNPFVSFGTRSKLTYTKSLPRTPNLYCYGHRKEELNITDDCDTMASNDSSSHVRGAIDIVKGLEQKRQRRKEKFYTKQSNRKSKGLSGRKPQPGMGAERMREVGLIMAGKAGGRKTYILSA